MTNSSGGIVKAHPATTLDGFFYGEPPHLHQKVNSFNHKSAHQYLGVLVMKNLLLSSSFGLLIAISADILILFDVSFQAHRIAGELALLLDVQPQN